MHPVEIQQQIINDVEVSGLSLTFWRTQTGEARLRIEGDHLLFGNRDFQFDSNGHLVGVGTAAGSCPTYLQVVS